MKTTHKTIAAFATAAFATIAGVAASQAANCALIPIQGDERITGDTVRTVATPYGSSLATLAGRWKCTTITGYSVTDHHIALRADGTFAYWRHAVGRLTGNESTTEPEMGRWTVRGSSFVFMNGQGEMEIVPFRFDGQTIVLPNDWRKVWERAR